MLIFIVILAVGGLCVPRAYPPLPTLCLILARYHRAAIFAGTNSYRYPRQLIQALCECTQILAGRVLIYIHRSPSRLLAGLRNEPCMSFLPSVYNPY